MVLGVAYGSDNLGETFYVQTFCDQEHIAGEICQCRSFGEDFKTIESAISYANRLAKKLNVEVVQFK